MTSAFFHFLSTTDVYVRAFALSSVAIEQRTMSLTLSYFIAIKKRSNTEKKVKGRKSCVHVCKLCKYSHLVGEVL